MTLAQRVTDDLKTAMKAKDQVRLAVVRAVRGEILKQESAGSGKAASDDDVRRMVKTLIKQRQESSAMWRQAGRLEQAEREAAEITLLQDYLPASLTGEDLAALVRQTIATTGAQGPGEMGAVIKAVMAAIRERGLDADGREVSSAVKTALGA